MGIVQRIGRTLKSKSGRLLDRLEDPAESVELARRRQREMQGETQARLEEVRSELAAIAANPLYGSSEAGRSKAQALAREEENLVDVQTRLQDRITEFDA